MSRRSGPAVTNPALRRKLYAREKVFIARLQGRLIVGPCEKADATCRGVICGHHRNGYEPEHHLDVVWLCNSHHAREHRDMRQAAQLAAESFAATDIPPDWLEPELREMFGL